LFVRAAGDSCQNRPSWPSASVNRWRSQRRSLAALLIGRDEAALAEIGDLAGQRRDGLVALDPDLGVARRREAVVARVEVVAQQIERLDAPSFEKLAPSSPRTA
jgi:hypothetical protein